MEPQGDGFEAMAVFNPTVIVEDGIFYMLYRAEDRKGVSRIGLAESDDGINFVRRPEPVLSPTERYEIWGGCEDPRVVKIEDTYYLTYTASSIGRSTGSSSPGRGAKQEQSCHGRSTEGT
jgi:predicted GH43/DUF377 family glycosyl hydrolase